MKNSTDKSVLYVPTKLQTVVHALAKEITIQDVKEQLDNNIVDINGDRIVYNALMEAYKIFGIFEEEDVEIRYKIESRYVYDEIENELIILLENYKLYVTDSSLTSVEDKKKILKNTWKFLELTLSRLVINCNPKTIEDDNREMNSKRIVLRDVLYNLEYKINNEKEIVKLLNIMQKTDANKIMTADMLETGRSESFYPAIMDIYRDYFLLKCIYEYDKGYFDKLKRHYQNTKLKKKKKIPFWDYSFLKLMKDVHKNQEGLYVFHMYLNAMNTDYKSTEELFLRLYKLDIRDNKASLSKKFENMPSDRLRFRKYSKFLD